MGKKIKLKENDLRNVVENVLNELDYKTYANAATRALRDYNTSIMRDKSDPRQLDRYRDFNHAAEKAFERDYPNDDREVEITKPWATLRGKGDKLGHLYTFDRHGSQDYVDVGKTIKDPVKSRPITKADLEDPAVKDLSDFYKGKSHYTPGKGWDKSENFVNKLTEAVVRGIAKKIKKKILKENVWHELDNDAKAIVNFILTTPSLYNDLCKIYGEIDDAKHAEGDITVDRICQWPEWDELFDKATKMFAESEDGYEVDITNNVQQLEMRTYLIQESGIV